MLRRMFVKLLVTALLAAPAVALAATAIPFTINLSKPVNVTTTGGTPRIALDVGGVTRYANYASGTGTAALTFSYATQAGDVDLDGISVSSPIQLNGGTIADLAGNPLTNLTFTPPNTTNVKVNYPSLGMDFVADADGRYTLNGTAYNTLPAFLTAAGGTFTRNSIGTYYDSAGVLQTATANTPRFDWDPVTHAAKGVLIEEGRTNFIGHSNCKTGIPYWYLAGTFTDNNIDSATTAPDGSVGARRWTFTTPGAMRAGSMGDGISGTVYTGSVWLKTADGTTKTGAATDLNDGGLANITITPTWTRFSSTNSSLNTFRFFDINLPSGTYHVWGYQLEAGAFPTSYIPTTTAAVTRAADVLTVPTGGWFSGTSGTQSAEFQSSNTYTRTARVIGYNSAGALISLTGADNQNWFDGSVLATSNTISSTLLNKAASAYTATNKFTVLNAGSVVSGGINGTFPIATASQFYFGNQSGGVNFLNGWIAKAKYYPTRVPNTQLQLMTQ